MSKNRVPLTERTKKSKTKDRYRTDQTNVK